MIVDFASTFERRSLRGFTSSKNVNKERIYGVNFSSPCGKDMVTFTGNKPPSSNISQDEKDKISMIHNIARSKDPRGEITLYELSYDSSDPVKYNVALVLDKIKDKEFILDIVKRFSKSKDSKTKEALGRAAGKIEIGETPEEIKKNRNNLYEQLLKLNNTFIDRGLVENLKKVTDKNIKLAAYERFATHSDKDIRAKAALALDDMNLDVEDTNKYLQIFLTDEDKTVRKNAVRYLEIRKIIRSSDPDQKEIDLYGLSTIPSAEVQKEIVPVLSEIKDEEFLFDIVKRFSKSKDPKLREDLGRAVGRIRIGKTPKEIEKNRNNLYEKLLKLNNPAIDRGLVVILYSITDKSLQLNAYERFAGHRDKYVRAKAALLLGNMDLDVDDVYNHLRSFGKDEDNNVRRNAVDYLKEGIKIGKTPEEIEENCNWLFNKLFVLNNPDINEGLAYNLSEITNKDIGIKAIKRFARHRDEGVRTLAAKAIDKINLGETPEEIEQNRNDLFSELFDIDDAALDRGLVDSLAQITDKNMQLIAFKKFARHEDKEVRALAASVLTDIDFGDINYTYKYFRAFCKDEDIEVRRAAVRNIGKLYEKEFIDCDIDNPDFLTVMNEPDCFILNLEDPKINKKVNSAKKAALLKRMEEPDFYLDWEAPDIVKKLEELVKLTNPKTWKEKCKLSSLIAEVRKTDPSFRFEDEQSDHSKAVKWLWKSLKEPDFLNEEGYKGKDSVKIKKDLDEIIYNLSNDPDPELRYNLVLGAANIPVKKECDKFLNYFSKRRPKERLAVAESIHKVSNDDVRDKIIERLSNPEKNTLRVRICIAPALATVKNPEVFERTRENLLKTNKNLIDDKSAQVRIAVAEELPHMKPEYINKTADILLQDHNPNVLAATAKNIRPIINFVEQSNILNKLNELSSYGNSKVRTEAGETLNSLYEDRSLFIHPHSPWNNFNP